LTKPTKQKIQLANACNKIITSIPINNGTTRFARDPLVVKKMADMMQDGGSIFRNKMAQINENWEDVLGDILRTNSNLRCNVCGN